MLQVTVLQLNCKIKIKRVRRKQKQTKNPTLLDVGNIGTRDAWNSLFQLQLYSPVLFFFPTLSH